MMKQRKMTCIVCPIGCELCVDKFADKLVITGNKCPRGIVYAEQEIKNPMRIVTSTVRIDGWIYPVMPVKTDREIPKGKIFEVMEILSTVSIKAPVDVGDIVVRDVLGLGVNIVATSCTILK